VVDEEGWTRLEKLGFVRRVFYFCILIVLGGAGLIYVDVQMYLIFPSAPYLKIIVISGLLIVFALATYALNFTLLERGGVGKNRKS